MTNKLIIGAVVGLVVWFLVELLFNIGFWPLVIGFLAGAAVVIVLLARVRGESPQQVVTEVARAAREVVTEPASTTNERAAQEQLLRACTAFVTSGGGFAVHEALRDTVEKLRGLVPRALEFSPESETTFNVVKLAREDLPNLLYAFIKMSAKDKEEATPKFSAQLSELSLKLSRLAEFINGGQRGQFDSESAFINLKFS